MIMFSLIMFLVLLSTVVVFFSGELQKITVSFALCYHHRYLSIRFFLWPGLLVRHDLFIYPAVPPLFDWPKCLRCYHSKLLDNYGTRHCENDGYNFLSKVIIHLASCVLFIRGSAQISSRYCSRSTRPISMCVGQEPSTLCVPTWRWARNRRYEPTLHFLYCLRCASY